MIKQLIIRLIKKHGILFILEIIREFLLEYRQTSVMNDINRQNMQNAESQQNENDDSFITQLVKKYSK